MVGSVTFNTIIGDTTNQNQICKNQKLGCQNFCEKELEILKFLSSQVNSSENIVQLIEEKEVEMDFGNTIVKILSSMVLLLHGKSTKF